LDAGLLEGKTCLVTGANSGIGKETTIGLSRMGATVIMVCRNKERGEAAKSEIIRKTGNSALELMLCDLSSLAQVRKLADEVQEEHDALHILVNNAGTFSLARGTTVDGFETTLAVNYFAPFLLTNLLLGLIRASSPSRIINVSSVAHYGGKINLNQIRSGKAGALMTAYSNAKLALVMFTYELARREQGSGVTVNCLHPGAVATRIWRLPTFLTRAFMISAKSGAETTLDLASSPELEVSTGKYFDNKKEMRSSAESYDEEKAKLLWDTTCKLVGLPISRPSHPS
jgi:NAD(P)-dependent dehydrogenase (short-subunit alcohol dehydrogenase family)